MVKNNKKQIGITINEELYTKLAEFAKAYGWSKSDAISFVLANALKDNNKKENIIAL